MLKNEITKSFYTEKDTTSNLYVCLRVHEVANKYTKYVTQKIENTKNNLIPIAKSYNTLVIINNAWRMLSIFWIAIN